MHRRDFLASTLAPLSAGLAIAAGAARLPPRALRLRVAFVAPADGRPGASRGARLGAEEAAHAARLLGGEVSVAEGDDAAALLRDARPHAIVGGWSAEQCERLAGPAAAAGALFVNVGAADDRLRASCARHIFHVAPSEAMRRDARALAGAPAADVLTWHGSLEAFGAGQLNDRFRARYAAEMDEDAWAAWFAVKALTEAGLRASGAQPAAIGAYLAREGTRFDGHKGRPLSFRAWDHQLRQPLYVISQGRPDPMEVPPRGGGSVAEQLDRLGGARRSSECG